MSNQVLFGDVPLGMRKTFNGIISDCEVIKATDLYTVYKHTRILPNGEKQVTGFVHVNKDVINVFETICLCVDGLMEIHYNFTFNWDGANHMDFKTKKDFESWMTEMKKGEFMKDGNIKCNGNLNLDSDTPEYKMMFKGNPANYVAFYTKEKYEMLLRVIEESAEALYNLKK